MHDPKTVAHEIKIGKKCLVTVWHVDPETDGTDDSCGWPWPNVSKDDEKIIDKIIDWEIKFPYLSTPYLPVTIVSPKYNYHQMLAGDCIAYIVTAWNQIAWKRDGRRKMTFGEFEHVLNLATNPDDNLRAVLASQDQATIYNARRLTCECGRPMYADSSRPSSVGKKYFYYRCSSGHWDTAVEKCPAKYYRAKEVDESVWRWIKALLQEPNTMIQLIEDQLEQLPQPEEIEKALKQTRQNIERNEMALARVYQRAAKDEIGRRAAEKAEAAIRAEIAELQGEAAKIREALIRLSNRDELLLLSEQVRFYEAAMALDDEPFEIRLDWVETLNLTGTIFWERKEIDINCDVGVFTLPIEGTPSGKWCFSPQSVWAIRDVISIE